MKNDKNKVRFPLNLNRVIAYALKTPIASAMLVAANEIIIVFSKDRKNSESRNTATYPFNVGR